MSLGYSSASLNDEIISLVKSNLIYNYCTVSAAVIVIYDHICTITREVMLIWGKSLDSTRLLFHVNRWLISTWAILTILTTISPLVTVTSCAVLAYIRGANEICLYILWAAFLGIRVYALSGRSRAITSIVVLISIVPVGTNAFYDYTNNYWQVTTLPLLGNLCSDTKYVPEASLDKLVIVTRACVIAADAIVLVATWSRTWPIFQTARRQNVWSPLLTMTLRDGTLYFLALLLLNALSIAGWLNNVFVDASGFSIPLSSIIISHFLLNLRQIANVPMGGDNSASAQDEELDGVYSHISTPVLSSFLGNMGELLDDHHETDMIDVMWKEADGVQHDAKHARVDHHAACNALDHHVTLADGQPSIGQGHSKPVAIVTA